MNYAELKTIFLAYRTKYEAGISTDMDRLICVLKIYNWQKKNEILESIKNLFTRKKGVRNE